jgi:hypothetical protein
MPYTVTSGLLHVFRAYHGLKGCASNTGQKYAGNTPPGRVPDVFQDGLVGCAKNGGLGIRREYACWTCLGRIPRQSQGVYGLPGTDSTIT